jgi:hypothetical protein
VFYIIVKNKYCLMKWLTHLLTLLNAKRLAPLLITTLLAACQSASEKVSGTYEATLPAASGPGRVLELELNEDQAATLDTDFLDGQEAIVQKGSWARSGQDSLTVYFIEKDGSMVLDTLGLRIQGSQLILRDTAYGSEGATLMRRTR